MQRCNKTTWNTNDIFITSVPNYSFEKHYLGLDVEFPEGIRENVHEAMCPQFSFQAAHSKVSESRNKPFGVPISNLKISER